MVFINDLRADIQYHTAACIFFPVKKRYEKGFHQTVREEYVISCWCMYGIMRGTCETREYITKIIIIYLCFSVCRCSGNEQKSTETPSALAKKDRKCV